MGLISGTGKIDTLLVWAPILPFLKPKYGHFWQKWVLKMALWESNSKTTFVSPTSPENYGNAFGFKRLLLDGIKTHLFNVSTTQYNVHKIPQ